MRLSCGMSAARVLSFALCLFGMAQISDAGWTPKTMVGSAISYSYQCTTDAAAGANGDAVNVWLDESSGRALACVMRAGVWGSPQALYYLPTTGTDSVSEVRAAVGGDGTVYAATVYRHFQRYNTYQVVMVSTMAPGATSWSGTVEVSVRGSVSSVRIKADAAGKALVLWMEGGVLKSSSFSPGGAWSTPQVVPNASAPTDFAMNAAGTAAIVWSQSNGSASSTVRLLKRSLDGVWQTPVDVATVAGYASGPQVGIDGSGFATVVWLGGDSTGNQVMESIETAAGVFSVPESLSGLMYSGYYFDMSVDEAGDVGVVWTDMDSTTWDLRVFGELQLVSGDVLVQSWITTDVGMGASPPSVALGPDGSIAAFSWIDDGYARTCAVTWTRAFGEWSAPVVLGGGLLQNTVALACGPKATAWALWPAKLSREFYISYRASTFTMTYPAPTLTSITPWMSKLGGPALNISATGGNFALIPGITSMQWDGAARPTDPISLTSLTGHLSTDDFMVEGVHQATIANPAPGGGVSAPQPFIVDGSAPVTTFTLNGKTGQNGWFTGPVQVYLAGNDVLSGTKTTTYKIDTSRVVTVTFPTGTTLSELAAPKTTTLPLISTNKIHTVTFNSADTLGNKEASKILTIKIDRTVPTITAVPTTTTLTAAEGKTAVVAINGIISDVMSGLKTDSLKYTVIDEYRTCQPTGPITLGPGGAYSLPVTLDLYRKVKDITGRLYQIRITAQDNAGLIRNVTVRVTVK